MRIQFGKTLTRAFDAHRTATTSHRAIERQEQQGHRQGNEERVLALWMWLGEQNRLPCSMATAAAAVTELRGEHYFTAAQTNADVVRKRTADLMNRAYPPLERIPDQEDPDGRRRDHFKMATHP